MALSRLLLLLFAVSSHVSASPVASHHGLVAKDVADEATDGPPTLPTSLKPPIMPVVTQVTATYATTLILNPRDAPSPLSEGVVPLPAEANKGCTSTYSPPYLGTAACSWSGTLTVYPTTTVQYKQLNCNGCDSLFISDYWYFCPNMQINKTERVNTPSTFWSTICRPTPARLRQRDEDETQPDSPATATSNNSYDIVATAEPISNPITKTLPTPSHFPVANDLRVRDANQLEACPTTHVVQPPQSAGKTSTKYSRTTTTTALLNCDGCSLVVSTAVAGYGPPVVFTTTTTLPVGTVTAYACRP
ncbi:hypothetical protein QBC38DRAFT_365169 [Podospora fimiseda]|uniref:Uncharacterized protein n=1 Tax=Podospora fimiseda TaxID=252190 RepID=A0AAN7BPC4_9PEZI|nr:hypothetical protein QBC38DRAFT_365169 [Podospora fimiseda]